MDPNVPSQPGQVPPSPDGVPVPPLQNIPPEPIAQPLDQGASPSNQPPNPGLGVGGSLPIQPPQVSVPNSNPIPPDQLPPLQAIPPVQMPPMQDVPLPMPMPMPMPMPEQSQPNVSSNNPHSGIPPAQSPVQSPPAPAMNNNPGVVGENIIIPPPGVHPDLLNPNVGVDQIAALKQDPIPASKGKIWSKSFLIVLIIIVIIAAAAAFFLTRQSG